MIDWVEELLSMTAAEGMYEDADGESAVLSLGGMAVNAVPPGQAYKEETMDPVSRSQNTSPIATVDDEPGAGNGSVEPIIQQMIIPKGDGIEEKVAGMQSIPPFFETEGEPVQGLSQLARQIGLSDTIDLVERPVGDMRGIPAGSDESAKIGEQKRVKTEGDPGLQALYREVVQGTNLLGQAAVGRTLGGMAESGLPQQMGERLTVDGLDQAVRRDSRRYDGGMALF